MDSKISVPLDELVLSTLAGAGSLFQDWQNRWDKLWLANDEAYARALADHNGKKTVRSPGLEMQIKNKYLIM